MVGKAFGQVTSDLSHADDDDIQRIISRKRGVIDEA
ncbi:MAG: hypothetical protein RI897_105 [Verrucomicrobiota bacterium]